MGVTPDKDSSGNAAAAKAPDAAPQHVTLEGHIKVPGDRLQDIRNALTDHIRLTRAEPGCLRFDVTEDPDHPGLFTVQETFVDSASFRAHQTRVTASEWGRISAGIPRHYRITGLEE